MKKFFLLVSILFCLYLQGAAQDAAPTPFPENWQTLAPESDFSIEVPIKLEVEKYEEYKAFRYLGKLNESYFFILSEKKSEAFGMPAGLKYIREFQALGTKIAFGNSKGEKFAFKDDEGFFQRAIYIEMADRIYLFHTVSEKSGDEAAKRFLRSLSIRGRISSVSTDLTPEPPTISDEPGKAPPPRLSGGGTGSGVGSGQGSGSGSAADIKPQMPPANAVGVTQKVKILSKPRASYTDIARTYGIQGGVTLRITFLASGTIGAVTPISKLPMGLTNTAITAARSITFEPARRNGVPYTVTVMIQYGFTIY